MKKQPTPTTKQPTKEELIIKIAQPTKEELITKVAQLEREDEVRTYVDQQRRKEFARAFSWFQPTASTFYASHNRVNEPEDPVLPTWEQIFVHVGSLLSDRDLVNLTEKCNRLDAQNKRISEDLEHLQDKFQDKLNSPLSFDKSPC